MPHERADGQRGISRRTFLAAGGAATVGGAIAAGAIWRRAYAGEQRTEVFIGRSESYAGDLVGLIAAGLRELGVQRREIAGKRVLLKPNLVETAIGKPHINTHPLVVFAAAEALRSLGAAEVIVAEGQGHRRDSWIVLEESGMRRVLDDGGLRFVDLNHDDVEAVANLGRWTKLERLHLPRTLLGVDLIVSMPKLKTHHWAGVTCAMKNLFGVMPGVVYGWPKNVLHWHGIPESILDINAAVRPQLSIVDGIVGMEGDGPIMGSPKELGCIVMGRSATAVDATCTRLMRLDPARVDYLAKASGRLGSIRAENIEQRGESIKSLARSFAVLDAPHLRGLARRG